MSNSIYHDIFRKDSRSSSVLDPDLDFRVSKILSKITGQSKPKAYDNYSQPSSYTPTNPNKSYSPYTNSYSSYEKDRNSQNYLSTTASSYFLAKSGEGQLKKSLFTAPSYLDSETRGRRERSPIKDHQDALNQRIDEAISRSRYLTKLSSNSPLTKEPQYPSTRLGKDIDLINQKADQALRRSWHNLERSGHYSPYSQLRNASPMNQSLSQSYFLPVEKPNRHVSPLKDSYLGSKSFISSGKKTPSKYSTLFSDSKHSSKPVRNPKSEIDDVFNEAMRRSQAIINKGKEKAFTGITKPASSQQRKPLEDYSRNETRYSPKVQSALQSVTELKARDLPVYSEKTGKDSYSFNNAISTLSPNQKVKVVDEKYDNGTTYRGDKFRGSKHGRGVFTYQNGSQYDGEWEDNLRNGYGTQTLASGEIEYEGEWLEDKYHGTGYQNNSKPRALSDPFDYKDFSKLNGAWTKYEGEFQLGKWHGLGTLYLSNGERLVGKFRYDQVDGAGTFYQQNGENVTAEWSHNKFVGSL